MRKAESKIDAPHEGLGLIITAIQAGGIIGERNLLVRFQNS
jgi:hypothetical protein